MRKILITVLLLTTMASPVLAKSEVYYNNQWYYKANVGWTYYIENQLVTGRQIIDGKEYCFDSTGKLAKGWVQVDNNWLYTNSQGIVQHNWKKINGNWYFFNPLGYMEHDTIIDGYRIDSNGIWVQ